MTVHVPRPDWLPNDYKCWGQHGDTAPCLCGKAYVKWLRRGAAHASGRHKRPQVDCWACWNTGQFTEPPPATDGLWHTGQHADCSGCSAFRASEAARTWESENAPRHTHVPSELCGPDCARYWWEAQRSEQG